MQNIFGGHVPLPDIIVATAVAVPSNTFNVQNTRRLLGSRARTVSSRLVANIGIAIKPPSGLRQYQSIISIPSERLESARSGRSIPIELKSLLCIHVLLP